MKFHVILVSWFNWYSDIRETIYEYTNEDASELERIVQECRQTERWINRERNKEYLSILIEPVENT